MKELDKKKAENEWGEILKNYPSFARTFLVQQAILIEASELGYKFVDRSMCKLISSGLPVLFEDYWIRHCNDEMHEVQIGGIIGCISTLNRDPARCFDISHGWFEDPFARGQVIPPKPPVPPL